jgi:quercetin dioxygenase-like cupin family protein/hemerythrin-like domain-containing protein
MPTDTLPLPAKNKLHTSLDWFIQDHDLLIPALDALLAAVEAQQPPSQALLRHIHDHMAEHFGLEETVLFPVVPFKPSVVLLLAEHDQLWQLWQGMAIACQAITANWPEAVQAFCHKMHTHIHEENACLLPSCQRDMPLELLLKLHRQLEQAQLNKHWQPRAPLPRKATLLPMADSDRLHYRIQPDCRVEWVSMPKGQQIKPHVSPHAQTVLLLSGQVMLTTPDWSGLLSHAGQAVQLDPVVMLAIDAQDHSRLLLLKAPVVYPTLS